MHCHSIPPRRLFLWARPTRDSVVAEPHFSLQAALPYLSGQPCLICIASQLADDASIHKASTAGCHIVSNSILANVCVALLRLNQGCHRGLIYYVPAFQSAPLVLRATLGLASHTQAMADGHGSDPPGRRQRLVRAAQIVTAISRMAPNSQNAPSSDYEADISAYPAPNPESNRSIYQTYDRNRPSPQPRPTPMQQSSAGSAYSSTSSPLHHLNQPSGQGTSPHRAQSSNNAWFQPQAGQGHNNFSQNQFPPTQSYGSQSQQHIQPPPAVYGGYTGPQPSNTYPGAHGHFSASSPSMSPLLPNTSPSYPYPGVTHGPLSASPPSMSPPLPNTQPVYTYPGVTHGHFSISSPSIASPLPNTPPSGQFGNPTGIGSLSNSNGQGNQFSQ